LPESRTSPARIARSNRVWRVGDFLEAVREEELSMKAGEEIEAKFDVDPATPLPSFERAAEKITVVELPPLELTASYYDTPGLRLLSRGATLRHRAGANGEEDLWTLKLPSPTGGHAAYSRQEISWSGDSPEIPPKALELVTALTLQVPVSEVAVLVSSRRRLEVRNLEGDRLAEIDDDTVAVRKPTTTTFRQVEVELTGGQPRLLSALAEQLHRAGATRGADEPKLVRALGGLVARHDVDGGGSGGSNVDGTKATRANGKSVNAGLTVSDVVSASLRAGLERLVSNDPGVRIDENTGFVHQARVATRRLRSDLETFADLLQPEWVERVRDDLKWVGGALGRVRDADVLADRLRSYAQSAGEADAEGFAVLLVRLARHRMVALSELREVMTDARYVRVLREVEEAAAALPLAEGVDGSASAAPACRARVRRAWKRADRRIRLLGPQPTDVELHRVRIAAKQLRYAAEAAEASLGRDARRLAKAAAGVQATLGHHQDTVAAQLWAREAVDSLKPAGVLAVGEVVALERVRQEESRLKWAKSKRHLRKAAKKRPPW
jgi:CHAD domain-containing protein